MSGPLDGAGTLCFPSQEMAAAGFWVYNAHSRLSWYHQELGLVTLSALVAGGVTGYLVGKVRFWVECRV